MTAALSTSPRFADALSILPQTRDQSRTLAHAETARFIELLEKLDPDDWGRPTACDLWSVRDIAAHQASHVEMGTGFRGFWAQVNPIATRPYMTKGRPYLDALNQAQVEKRRGRTPQDLIAELRDGMPVSIEARQHMTWLARQVRIPVHPAGLVSLGVLFDTIFPRDMWMHRHDIAAATGKPFVQTRDHDGVIVEKTVLDMAKYAARRLQGQQLVLTLRGVSGGTWSVGSGSPINVSMEAADFMRRTSERISVEDALKLTESDAADDVTRRVLAVMLAPY